MYGNTDCDVAMMVAQWQHGTTVIENNKIYLEVVAVFDHDYQQHILFLGHDMRGYRLGYSLWFLGLDVDASFVQAWDCLHPPFVESAIIVQEWREMYSNIGEHDVN